MKTAARFSYELGNGSRSQGSLLARLPITLNYKERSITAAGLLDSGSTVNVLPYEIGLELGLNWEEQTMPVVLTGSLGRLPARGVVLQGRVNPFPPIELAFAWTQAPEAPLILGQINFFLEFEVCFFRAQAAFEVKPRSR